jgi:hypothetical protein
MSNFSGGNTLAFKRGTNRHRIVAPGIVLRVSRDSGLILATNAVNSRSQITTYLLASVALATTMCPVRAFPRPPPRDSLVDAGVFAVVRACSFAHSAVLNGACATHVNREDLGITPME